MRRFGSSSACDFFLEEGASVKNRPVEITKELVAVYGFSLLEDPERLGQLLEDKCPDCRQEIFILTFALREISRGHGIPGAKTFAAEREKISERLGENLGFSPDSAKWATSAIVSILDGEYAPESGDGSGHIEARRGFLTGASGIISKRPRTAPLRRKALRNGLLLLGILLVFLGLFFRIALSRFPMGDEHRLVFLAHLSGPQAAAGHVRLKAAQLAADQINALGGVKGNAIHLEGRDLPYNPAQAVAVVRDLLRDRKIIALLSACADDVNRAVAELANAEELPLIATESREMSVTMATPDRPWLYSFRTNYDTPYEGRVMAYFLSQGLGGRPAALLHDPDDAESVVIRESFISAVASFGGAVIAEASYSGKGGLSKEATAILGSAPAQAVVLANPTPEIAAVIFDLREAGFTGTILGCAYDDALQNAAGSALDNSWWIVPASPGDPQLLSFQTSYRDKYNEQSSHDDLTGAVLAYDSVRWMADALYRAPGFQGEALRHALLSTRNLALTHATLTIDPRTHGPWNKAASLIYCDEGRGRFQKRFWPR